MANCFCFWFYSMMGVWSTWQWVVLDSSQFFWSFDTPETPGSVSVVFAENEIWNRLKQFLPVCQGCLMKQNHPLSSNLMVWCAKIGSKTKNPWKTIKKPSYFDVFLSFWPNFSAPNYQIWTQWMISLLQTPLGSLGRLSNGVKHKLYKSVTVKLQIILFMAWVASNFTSKTTLRLTGLYGARLVRERSRKSRWVVRSPHPPTPYPS